MHLYFSQFIFPIILLSNVLVFAPAVSAAKPRIRKAGVARRVTGLSFSTARLSRATHSVIVNFINLNKAKSVAYELSYLANGITQGVVGSLVLSGQTTETRDLYFGTCSHGVCTPHWNITNGRLCVTTTLTTNATNRKCYWIRKF